MIMRKLEFKMEQERPATTCEQVVTVESDFAGLLNKPVVGLQKERVSNWDPGSTAKDTAASKQVARYMELMQTFSTLNDNEMEEFRELMNIVDTDDVRTGEGYVFSFGFDGGGRKIITALTKEKLIDRALAFVNSLPRSTNFFRSGKSITRAQVKQLISSL
jgi:hypothetical protein